MTDSLLTKVILHIIVSVCVVVWAIVGFVFWIPLLFRATMVFSALVIHATITNQSAESVRAHLEAASAFYPNGFRIAISVLRVPSQSPTRTLSVDLNKVIIETLWTLLFWFISLLILGAITFTAIIALIAKSFNVLLSFAATNTLFSIGIVVVLLFVIVNLYNRLVPSRKRPSR